MFDVGFAELVLVFVIGLLVLGPERLPKVAAEIGKWVGRARRTATQLRRQLEREIELNEVTQPPPNHRRSPRAAPPPGHGRRPAESRGRANGQSRRPPHALPPRSPRGRALRLRPNEPPRA